MKRTLLSILLLVLAIGTLLLGACGTPASEVTDLVITNLQVIPVPELGANSYRISVDVENSGDTATTYEIPLKIDDISVEYYTINDKLAAPVQVELGPSQKKTVSLTTAEQLILGLGSLYKSGEIDQAEHTISVDVFMVTITLAESLYQLQLLSTTVERANGYLTVSGQVKNISSESLQNVQALIEYYDSDGLFIKSGEALIEYNPVLSEQTSPFEVITTDNPAIARYQVSFKFLLGNTITTEDLR